VAAEKAATPTFFAPRQGKKPGNQPFSTNLVKTAPNVTTVTSQCHPAPYILYRTTGNGPDEVGAEIMSWQKSAIVTMDCFAVIAGLLIASPFFLILASPFLVTY
jgi:hypothetical protein